MNISQAIELTAEIITFLQPNERYPIKKCQEKHPIYNVKCEKTICTNGKHYCLVGNPPTRQAKIWIEKETEAKDVK
jgi:hypothetical protein